MSGKGSKQRPTDKAAFDANFDKIFGKKNINTDNKGKCDENTKREAATKENKK